MRTITIKDIYNDVSCINPSVSTISSIGDYIEEGSRQVAQSVRDRITKSLPQGTLAHKIITETLKDFFTDKQLWVIAYELQKNEEYVKNLSNEIERREQIAERKAQASKAKLSANKDNSQEVLDFVKANKKLLKDYYAFVKSNKKYSKEFYSKKFSFESANEFINK